MLRSLTLTLESDFLINLGKFSKTIISAFIYKDLVSFIFFKVKFNFGKISICKRSLFL